MGRSGAIPLAAINLAADGEPTSFCTATESPSRGRGDSVKAGGAVSVAVSTMKDLQPPERQQLVTILDRRRLPGYQRRQAPRGHDVGGEIDLHPDALHQRVDHPGVPEEQPRLDARHGVLAD